jgi:hypothetical protein
MSILGLFSCHNKPKKSISEISIPVEKIIATKDQQERRKHSEAYCELHNIPFYKNPTALFVDPEEQVVIRAKDKVVDRAVALFYTGLKSEGLSDELLAKLEKAYQVKAKLTSKERVFAFSSQPTEQQKIDANWKYECLHVLLWSLGFVDTLSYPDQLCVVADDVKIIHDLTERQFREKAKLRSKKEILDQADLILRLNWACVNARINNKPAPGNLNSEVVQERHYALNWLIRCMDQAWDDVETNT